MAGMSTNRPVILWLRITTLFVLGVWAWSLGPGCAHHPKPDSPSARSFRVEVPVWRTAFLQEDLRDAYAQIYVVYKYQRVIIFSRYAPAPLRCPSCGLIRVTVLLQPCPSL